MEIMIKIDEKDYQSLKDGHIPFNVLAVIMNGTPLPKGHGDLIDRRELKKDVYTTTEWNGDVHRIIYEASVDDAPVVVEADKE